MNNKDIVMQFQMAAGKLLQGKAAEPELYLAENVQWHLPDSLDKLAGGAHRKGHDEVIDLVTHTVKRFYKPETMQFEFLSMIADDDFVHMHFALSAETPQGKAYSSHYQTLFRLKDGKIAEVWEYFDSGRLLGLFSD